MNSTSVIASSEVLKHVPCIKYFIQFQAQLVEVLVDFDSEVNVMTLTFANKLGYSTQLVNIGAPKIDGFALKTYTITIVEFSIQDELGKIRFFEETFLLADTSIDIVLGMSFLSLSNANIQFDTGNFTWRTYSTAETLPTIKKVELIDKHKFTRAALDKNSETFVVHVAVLKTLKLALHPSRTPLLAALQQDKAFTKISSEYVDYADVFSPDLAIELPENIGINKYAIELIEAKQLSYKLI